MSGAPQIFYEFFAGGGLARAGLGAGWRCLLANDIDEKKAAAYADNWGDRELRVCDVASLKTSDMPGHADLAWASFPCQDLSLAGMGAGLGGARSGAFWPFWELMRGLAEEQRPPRLIVLENVVGALTSHGGRDFAALCQALSQGGYRYGALVMDAARFLPQSRPRLFLVAVRADVVLPLDLPGDAAPEAWAPAPLVRAHARLPEPLKAGWIWWRLPEPPRRSTRLDDLLEPAPTSIGWHSAAETERLLRLMHPAHRERVREAQASKALVVGTLYKRTRPDGSGGRKQRAEVRFDGVAGCLRTPSGGSSRQCVLLVQGESLRSRLLTAREAARLMGLPDSYRLPMKYNEAYHLAGDGVAVPVVRHLAAHLLEPVLAAVRERNQETPPLDDERNARAAEPHHARGEEPRYAAGMDRPEAGARDGVPLSASPE